MHVGYTRRADSRNVVAPYAGRIGAGALAPLLGANGDGLRSVSALVGPTAVGNVFSGLGGDGISIFGAAPRGCAPVLPAASVQVGGTHREHDFGTRVGHMSVACMGSADSCSYRRWVSLVAKLWPAWMVSHARRRTTSVRHSVPVQRPKDVSYGDRGRAGGYAVIAGIDPNNSRVTVAVPCTACVGGLSPGAEVGAGPMLRALCGPSSPELPCRPRL